MEQPGCIAGGSGQPGLRSWTAASNAVLLPVPLVLIPCAVAALGSFELVALCSTSMKRMG